MQVQPSRAEGRIARAWINEMDGHRREALADTESAAKMRSSCKEGKGLVHVCYARLLMCYGRPEEALRQYRLAREAFPSDPVLVTLEAHPYLARGDLETALKCCKRAMTFEDRCFTAHYWASRVYEEMTNFPNAVLHLERSDQLAADPKGKQFYDDLLRAFKKDGAKGYWEKRLEAALGESPPDLYRIPAILAHLDRMPEAYRYLDEACRQGKYGLGESLSDLCWNREDEEFKGIAKKYWGGDPPLKKPLNPVGQSGK